MGGKRVAIKVHYMELTTDGHGRKHPFPVR